MGKRIVKLRPAITWAGVGVLLAAALAYQPAYSQSGGLTLPYSGTVSSSSTAFAVSNSGTGIAISGGGGSGKGVLGTSSTNYGVQGSSNSSNGVVGIANTSGAGVYGQNATTSGTTYGVFGQVASSSGYGVYGVNNATAGSPVGVYGAASSPAGYGMYGVNTATSGNAIGIYGESSSPSGYGIYAQSTGSSGTAIYAYSPTGSNTCINAQGGNTAIIGSGYVAGIYGHATALSGGAYGVNGTVSGGGAGVEGYGEYGFGVYASCSDTRGYALYATVPSGGTAASLNGDVSISGTLTCSKPISAPSKSFKIDHPLDPANKYLMHACVESNEMANTYSGNVVLDQYGKGTVELPSYCQALNKDFRYQLTCIGKPAPVYIAEEVDHNRFMVAGGTPGLKVSWQVTGTRHDTYATAHPLVVEPEKKGQERGTYLFPVEAGKSQTLGLNYQLEQAHKLPKLPAPPHPMALKPHKMPAPLPMLKPDLPTTSGNTKP